jgi:pyruvate/2-oxoglutarate dehydrogenase complex dihydrolipoamide dehydrogenase (E3) component
MVADGRYDVIIVGSGQSGGPLSTAFVSAGKRVALIERVHIGGCCINEGCTPTKTMVASARVAYLAGRADEYGVHVGAVHVDMEEVRARKRAIVKSFRDGSAQRIRDGGVEIIAGEARFVDAHSLEVLGVDGNRSTMQGDLIVINTGCRPATVQIEGIEDVPTYDSTTIMELDEVPSHLVVLGGGYIGLEFAQMFRRFGSRVTVIEKGPRLAAKEDDDISDAMMGILQEDGIELVLNADARRVSTGIEGGVRVTVGTDSGDRTIEGSHLLVAAGRTPNTDALDPAAAGVEIDGHGYVRVDERLRTNVPHIYALGDVAAGQPQFTHISYDDFRIMRENLIEGKDRTTAGRLVPYTVFTDPQLGRVGMTEAEAKKAGRDVKVASMPMNQVARALEMDESRGMVKAVVDAESGEILGAAVLGIEGGEVMAMFEIAMLGRVPYTVLRDGIWAHPTLAELLNNLFAGM